MKFNSNTNYLSFLHVPCT